jgi:predicted nucleotidyltransferase
VPTKKHRYTITSDERVEFALRRSRSSFPPGTSDSKILAALVRKGEEALGQLAPGERDYLRVHWPLLSELHGALLDEHDVRLAVLYGSLARGDEDAGSDLDLLVSLASDDSSAGFELAVRLKRISGRRVDIAHLSRVEAQAPLLLDRVLDEGRVLIDRNGQWEQLCERRSAIRVRARRDHSHQMAGAARAIRELTG